jgi:branched-chain amino acid transport system ATP-binding protein
MTIALRTSGLSKRFGGLQALDSVDLEIEQGGIHAIIGPNGAGKTTLFNIVAGSLRPSAGRVLLGERDITAMPPEALCALGLARTFQIPRPFASLSVLDNVSIGCIPRSRSAREARELAREAVARLELAEHAHKLAGSLPIGLRKRLEVARAVATRPVVLLLDEVMGGLHGAEVERMIETIRKLNRDGITVLLIEHVMAAVISLAGTLTVLDQGRVLASGAPAEMIRNERVIAAYLGDEVL